MSLHPSILGIALALAAMAASAQENLQAHARVVDSAAATAVHTGLNFGSFTRPSTGAGQVILRSNGTATPSTGVVCTGSVLSGKVRIVGGIGQTYTLTLPSKELTLVRQGATAGSDGKFPDNDQIKVGSFALDPSTPTTGLISGSGSMDLNYGATAHFSSTTELGAYVGTYQVLIAFN